MKPRIGLRIRPQMYWMVDMDYLEQLSPDEFEFIRDFIDQYYCGNDEQSAASRKCAMSNMKAEYGIDLTKVCE